MVLAKDTIYTEEKLGTLAVSEVKYSMPSVPLETLYWTSSSS